MFDVEPEYVAARRVLLDALTALEDHLDNLVLVGAQAVYHHTGDADLNVPLFTTDGDLALNTSDLSDSPEIGSVLQAAGFAVGPNPGRWIGAGDVGVDLMVVPHQAGIARATARAARIAPHDRKTARIAPGLEPALIDNALVDIVALEGGDDRTFALRVAGPAALLTAKAIKISERLAQADSQPDRLKEKDALDAFRLLQAVDTAELAAGFEKHKAEEHAAEATAQAIKIYQAHATATDGRIVTLASAAAQDDPSVAPAFAALVGALLDAL